MGPRYEWRSAAIVEWHFSVATLTSKMGYSQWRMHFYTILLHCNCSGRKEKKGEKYFKESEWKKNKYSKLCADNCCLYNSRNGCIGTLNTVRPLWRAPPFDSSANFSLIEPLKMRHSVRVISICVSKQKYGIISCGNLRLPTKKFKKKMGIMRKQRKKK